MTPRFGVSDFVAVANQALDVAFGTVEIEGEVASFKVNQKKFVFFDLKDDESTISCFMSVWQLRLPIEDGMRVVVRASPKLTAWGKFSLTVHQVTPLGEGALKRSADALRLKLQKEGLFDDGRKRLLPKYPQRVAIISSTQAAGYADFMKIANERWSGVHFLVAHTQVQGSGASEQIIEAIQKINRLSQPPEVIVIIRGGGSADDLSTFNEEPLVRAVAASRIPIMTGIGHEIDESLCDLAADVRASTPSNAAQLLLPDKQDVLHRMNNSLEILSAAYVRQLDRIIEMNRETMKNIKNAWLMRIDQSLQMLQAKKPLIDEYNPDSVLRRGYAIVRGDIALGNVVQITTEKLKATAQIIETLPTNNAKGEKI